MNNYQVEVQAKNEKEARRLSLPLLAPQIKGEVDHNLLRIEKIKSSKGLFGVFSKKNTYRVTYKIDKIDTHRLEDEIEDIEMDIDIDGEFNVRVESEGVKFKVAPPGKSGEKVKYSEVKETLANLEIQEINWGIIQNELAEPSETWQVIAPRKPELDRDAEVKIEISEDKLTGLMSYKPAHGGKKLNQEDLLKLLKNAGIKYGIDKEKIEEIVFSRNPVEEVIIAKGEKPKPGEDANLIYHFVTDENKVGTQREDGSIDFYDLGQIANVAAGDVLVTKEEAKSGEPGTAVTGEEIPPSVPKDCDLPKGKNVEKKENKVLAVKEGQAIRDGKKVHVLPVHEVNGDVDLSIGNIDFVGNVLVKGDVREGFKIKAEGNVEVKGRVSAASIDAGNEVIIRSGFIGKDKGEIKAKGNVKVRFIENGRIESRGNVFVAEAAMHSSIFAGQSITVKEGKGLLVGGESRASSKIEAKIVGSSLATKTLLEVGIDPRIRDEIKELQEEIEDAKNNLLKSNKALKMLEKLKEARGSLSEDKELMYYRLKKTEKNLNKAMKNKRSKLQELEAKAEKSGKGKITVHEKIYPGTKLIIGKAQYNVQDELRVSTFVKDKGEVKQIPL